MGPPSVIDMATALAGVARIGLDTAPIIYYVEEQQHYFPRSFAFFERIARGELRGYSSVLTLTETLTHPRRMGNEATIRAYQTLLLDSENLSLLDVNAAIADTADLRARHNLRTPDAIQIATALAAGCEVFLTNDREFRRVTELRVVVLDELTLATE